MLVVGGLSLTRVPLSWDEGATLSAVTRSPGQLVQLAKHMDAVIAPYYLVLHVLVWIFGESDVVLRLPSLLAMAVGVGVTAELSVVSLGQTARPYAFAFLFATLSSLLLLAAVQTPTWSRWVGYGLCLALTGIFHLVAVAVLAARGDPGQGVVEGA
jgi:mannosyltransferase